MHTRSFTVLTALSLAFLLALSGPGLSAVSNFQAPMSGDQEVSAEPVLTDARGIATFRLSHDGTELTYRLNVSKLHNVTQAHIHLAPAGVNGPVVVWLYPDGPPAQLIPGRTDGMLATGVITDGDLVGQLAGQTVADLVARIEAGEAYVNVHTSQYPGGEIRGQIH